MEPPSSLHGGVIEKRTTYRAVPKDPTPCVSRPPLTHISRVEGGPYLLTLCEPVGDSLQFSHGLLILEVVGEGLCPLL